MKEMYFPNELHLLDYSLSHSILLLRTTEVLEGGHKNTDLLFGSTFYVELPIRLYQATLFQGTIKDFDYVRSRCNEETARFIELSEVFVITAFGRRYYIGARQVQVFANTYDPLETSIGLKRG